MASTARNLARESATKSVAVFSIADFGADSRYAEFARDVATMFAKKNWELVYSGSALGLIGVLGQAASAMGVDVHGVQTRRSIKCEDNGKLPASGDHELVDDIYSQRRRLAELGDAFLILPGGFGTLEEYSAIRTWSTFGNHRRPIVLLNFEDFYTPFLDWLAKAIELGFISENIAAIVSIVSSIEEMSIPLSRPQPFIKHNEDLSWSIVAPRDGSSSQPEWLPSDTEKLLFDTADQISIRHSLTVHFSTWHTRDYYNRIEPDMTEADDRIWKAITPFTTCVGMSFLVAKNLRAALETTTGLAPFSERLMIVACPISVDSSQPYHSLVCVFMDDYCVVIDLIFSAKAFKVPYNGSFVTLPYITTSLIVQQRRFRYITEPSGETLLTMEKIGSSEAAVRFSKIDHDTALREISMRAARNCKPNTRVPNKKVIVVRSLMNKKPTKIASTRLDAEFIVTACRVQVDFSQQTLKMQIPLADWLLKPENERYRSQLQTASMYTPVNDAVVNLVVDTNSLPDDNIVLGHLHLMAEVGERLGLARGEVLRIANSMAMYGVGKSSRTERCSLERVSRFQEYTA